MELGSDGSSTVKPSVAADGLVECGPDKSRGQQPRVLLRCELYSAFARTLATLCRSRDRVLPAAEELLQSS